MGYCECGCGEPTRRATRTSSAKGHVKGQPQRFVIGHRIRLNAAQLNRDRAIPWRQRVIENAAGCLIWQGGLQSKGYGCIGEKLAHVNRVVLDAAVTADGTYSAWMAPRAPGMPGAGVWLARLAPIDVGWHGSLRRVHQCRPRDTQLSLDEASAA